MSAPSVETERTGSYSLDLALLDNIPPDLKARRQWIVWRYEDHSRPKPAKVPYCPTTKKRASSTDPSTWGTYAEAIVAYQQGGFDGVGFVFSKDDPYTGFDLDGCRNPETGHLEPWAGEIVEQMDTYTEASPSGTGVHMIGKGTLPAGGRKKGSVEMYDCARFFTVTGEHLGGTPTTIEDRTAELAALHAEVFGRSNGHVRAEGAENGTGKAHTTGQDRSSGQGFQGSDEELIAAAEGAKNGEKVKRLWGGDTTGYGSQSEADLALCSELAFWCGPDPARIDQFFRRSGLFRPKWDEPHFADGHTYGQETIAKALAGAREFYSTGRGNGAAQAPEKSPRAAQPGAKGSLLEFPRTDLGNGERLIARHGENLLYCVPWQKWYAWDGKRWASDDTQSVTRLSRETVRAYREEAIKLARRAVEEEKFTAMASLKHAFQSEADARLRAMMHMAQMDRPVLPEALDTDSWFLNLQNGTLDLRTGELRPHRREDLLTKLIPVFYDPAASCPLWEAFLERILAGRQDVIDFLQRALGYSLTGDTTEQCLFLLYGRGANGKSTFLEVAQALLGDYAEQADFDSFLHKTHNAVRNDLAKLRGARFVSAVEVEEGRRLAEVVVKQITGGDTITARFLFKEFFDFEPAFKLWLAANHKPVIRGTDHAIWRRLRLIPFTVIIPEQEQDPQLPAKLKAELPGILAWAVRGCLAWQQEGRLIAPEAVQAATQNYRSEMDLLSGFISECCLEKPQAQAPASDLYDAYKAWSGDKELTQTAFGLRLTDRGFVKGRSSLTGRVIYHGVGLLAPQGEQS